MCYYVCDPDWWWNPYNPATDYRGNVTQVTTYANGQNLTTPITETRRYDINGNLIKANTSCCAQSSLTYDVSNYYAYAIAKTSGSATDGFSQVKTTATFDFNTGLRAQQYRCEWPNQSSYVRFGHLTPADKDEFDGISQ